VAQDNDPQKTPDGSRVPDNHQTPPPTPPDEPAPVPVQDPPAEPVKPPYVVA
jgi:hypothetical protein